MAAYVLLWAVAIGCLASSIWAIADVASTTSEAFSAVGSSRKRWLMLIVFFTLALDVMGVILAITYFAVVRPKVHLVRAV